jgi:hypothetical protein
MHMARLWRSFSRTASPSPSGDDSGPPPAKGWIDLRDAAGLFLRSVSERLPGRSVAAKIFWAVLITITGLGLFQWAVRAKDGTIDSLAVLAVIAAPLIVLLVSRALARHLPDRSRWIRAGILIAFLAVLVLTWRWFLYEAGTGGEISILLIISAIGITWLNRRSGTLARGAALAFTAAVIAGEAWSASVRSDTAAAVANGTWSESGGFAGIPGFVDSAFQRDLRVLISPLAAWMSAVLRQAGIAPLAGMLVLAALAWTWGQKHAASIHTWRQRVPDLTPQELAELTPKERHELRNIRNQNLFQLISAISIAVGVAFTAAGLPLHRRDAGSHVRRADHRPLHQGGGVTQSRQPACAYRRHVRARERGKRVG